MSRVPRDVSGRDLARRLEKLGYRVVRQVGSHIRLRTEVNGIHNLTVPDHDALRVGTLAGIVGDVARHHRVTRDQVMDLLFN